MNKPLLPGESLLFHAAGLLDQIRAFEFPADHLVSDYFRAHPALGKKERQQIAYLVFKVIRHLSSLSFCSGEGASSRDLLLAAIVRYSGEMPEAWAEQLSALVTVEEQARLQGCAQPDLSLASPAVQNDLPEWLYASLQRSLQSSGDPARINDLAAVLNQPAPLDIRVNPLKTDRKTVLKRLLSEGMVAEEGRLSPFSIRLAGKPVLAQHPLFLEGAIEIQDEGSQLLALLLGVRRHELVLDFCAGAGGKTLLLGALMRNTGRIYAADISEKRLAKMKPRVLRSGLNNVFPMLIEHEQDLKLNRLAGKLDRVLVDAPCSGLGTLRRHPDLKWRQTPEKIRAYPPLQQKILSAAAKLLKPGGRLVYATCSLLPEENEGVVAAFLAQHSDFTVLPVMTELKRTGYGDDASPFLSLWPHRQGTDGFFAALLERKKG